MTAPGLGPQRLQKVLAAAGHGSRRTCEALIREGRVTIDDRVAILGDRSDPAHHCIEVDGVRVRPPQRTVVYLLNKPRGVISTAQDERGRRAVTDLVPAEPRVFPVGRLDRDTEGLLVLTNDGELAERILHPRHALSKTYVATVGGVLSDAVLRKLRRGVVLDDGPTHPKSVRVLARHKASTLVEIVVTEGRNRLVRRTFEAVGHPVKRLARTAIGPIRDPRLAPGSWRRLSPQEVAAVEGVVAGAATASRPRKGLR